MKKKIAAQELAKAMKIPFIRCLYCGIDLSDKEVKKSNPNSGTFYVFCCKKNEFVILDKIEEAYQYIYLNENGDEISYYSDTNITSLDEDCSNIMRNNNQFETLELNGFFPYKKFIKTKNFI